MIPARLEGGRSARFGAQPTSSALRFIFCMKIILDSIAKTDMRQNTQALGL
jgi:hypothetical protein